MTPKVKILIALALLLVGGGIIYAVTRKGLVGVGAATVKGSSKAVSLTDPCPGGDTIWDAVLGRCVPLVEEPFVDTPAAMPPDTAKLVATATKVANAKTKILSFGKKR